MLCNFITLISLYHCGLLKSDSRIICSPTLRPLPSVLPASLLFQPIFHIQKFLLHSSRRAGSYLSRSSMPRGKRGLALACRRARSPAQDGIPPALCRIPSSRLLPLHDFVGVLRAGTTFI